MKKLIFIIIFMICLQGIDNPTALGENVPPPYAKWGNIAVKETIKKYPDKDVVDYLHIGREDKNEKIAVEKFKLCLRDDNKKELGVYVDVAFDKKTSQFKEITFNETTC